MIAFLAARTGALRPFLLDSLLVLLLVALAGKVAWDRPQVRDLSMADETFYLMHGYQLPEKGLPSAEFSPVYALWYYGLSLLERDVTRLHDLNPPLVFTLLAVSLYLLVRSLGGLRVLAFLTAASLFFTHITLIEPYPAHFATIVLVLGAALACRCRSVLAGYGTVAATLLVAAYLRPELFVAFLGCVLVGAAAGCWVAWRRPEQRARLALGAVVLGTGTAVMIGVFGKPFGGGRSAYAFRQHFAWNRVEAGLEPPSAMIDFEPCAQAAFGDAGTFGECLRRNPRAVLWHVGHNLVELPRSLAWMVNMKYTLPPWMAAILPLVGLPIAGLSTAGLYRRLARRGWAGVKERRLGVGLFVTALVLLPTVAASLLIHPRQHYLIAGIVLGLALAAAGLSALAWETSLRQRLDSWPVLLAVVGLLLALAPNEVHGRFLTAQWTGTPRGPALPFRSVVDVLRQQKVRGPVVILEDGYSVAFYAGLPFLFVPSWEKPPSQGFWAFVRGRGINLMHLGPVISSNPRYAHDAEFQDFVSGRRTEDFVLIHVPGVRHPNVVAIRKDLLAAGDERK
jgi:hypothetical protein